MSKHQEQIIAAAKGKVDEELLGTAFAKPRGATTAAAGGVRSHERSAPAGRASNTREPMPRVSPSAIPVRSPSLRPAF